MTTTAVFSSTDAHQSVFTGVDVSHEAALTLPGGVRPPIFDDDFWDFTEVIGLPNQPAGQGQPQVQLHAHHQR